MAEIGQGKGLFARVLSLLARPLVEDEPPATAALRAAAPPPRPVQQSPSDFEDRLREVLERGGAAVSGRVHLLNLSRIAEHYGPRWPQLSEKVNQLIALTISRRLSPRDFFTRAKDGVYVIMFDGLSEAEAKLKCALLADEITGKLIGRDTGMDVLEVRSAVARVDGSVAFDSVSTLDALEQMLRRAELPPQPRRADDGPQWQAITELLQTAEREIAAWKAIPRDMHDGTEPVESLLGLLRQAESALAEQQEARTRRMLTMVEAGDTPGEAPADPLVPRIDALRGMLGTLIGQVEDELKTRRTGLMELSEDSFSLESAEVVFRYRPLWHVSQHVINAYECRVGLKCGSRVQFGNALLPPNAEPAMIGALDRLVLRKAVEDVHLLLEERRRNIVTVPVHHSTLTGGTMRREYVAVCNAIAPDLRPFIVFEIVDPIIGFVSSHIPPAVTLLRQYGRAVLLRLDIDHPRLEDFLNIGLHSVGVDVADSALPEGELMRKLELFRARAERYGLRSYVHGLRSISLTTAAVCAGFEYVSGEVVAGAVERPGGVHAFDIERFYEMNYPKLQSGNSMVRPRVPA